MIVNPIKETKSSPPANFLHFLPWFCMMWLQVREPGSNRTSSMKLFFFPSSSSLFSFVFVFSFYVCGKLMNHLLPMTRKKVTCLCVCVMNSYEVKFSVYEKYTLSSCSCKIIEFRIQSNALLQRQSPA